MFRLLLMILIMPLNALEIHDLAKKNWKKAVASAPHYPEESYSGRGIVIPAGGWYYLVNAYVNMRMLRDSGCQLPVEIWYIGEKEIVPPLMEKLEEMGAVCKDITAHFSYPIKGFEVKVHAIAASSFEEVMLLDADNVVLQNPEFLFDSPQYIENGALFWPDIQTIEQNNLLWSVLDLPPQKLRAQESGQLVINKKRGWRPLQLCLHMNKESHFYYKHIYGDKDTFQLSWKTMGAPFHMMEHLPGVLKITRSVKSWSYGQMQRDFDGNALFCHTTTFNWAQRTNYRKLFFYYTFPTRDLNNFASEKDQIFSDFQSVYPHLEPQCLHYMKEARDLLRNSN